MQVLLSDADVAAFALQHLGWPAECRDCTQPGNADRCQEAVDRVFTLTCEEVVAHLESACLPPGPGGRVRILADSRDGWYLIEREGEWDFYWQERGFPNFLWTFDDPAEARKAVINLLPTWLKRLHLPCRTKDGAVGIVP